MTKLSLASDLSLPIDAVTQRFAFLGRVGSGKTYGATKLAELMDEVGAQFVWFDPVGVGYGLRVPGTGPALRIFVFGGLHGDLPISPTAGALLADLIVDRGISAVLDVSQFEVDADKARFARDFAARFFFRKKAAPSAVHLFIDEAQEFVPENPAPNETLMLHAFTRMAKLGRNFGIGISLLSQRPQEISKKVLNLTECLFAFQMTGKHERDSVQAWATSRGVDDKKLKDVLPFLKVGEPHVWSPAWLDVDRVVTISEKRTANVSATPQVGANREVRELTPIDVEGLRSALEENESGGSDDDPKELRRRIAELEKKLAAKAGPTLAEAQVSFEMALVDGLRVFRENFETELRAFLDALTHPTLDGHPAWEAALRAPLDPRPVPPHEREEVKAARAGSFAREPPVSIDGNVPALKKGQRAVLTVIAQHAEPVTRTNISIITGHARSTRDRLLQELKGLGCTHEDDAGVTVTSIGRAALGAGFKPLPTGDALRRHWLATLPSGNAAVLEVICAAYPNDVAREAVSQKTEHARSTRDRLIQELIARRLVVPGATKGSVRANEALFSSAKRSDR